MADSRQHRAEQGLRIANGELQDNERSEVSGQRSGVRHGRDARYWIVFNGEIYNFKELREELGAESKEQEAKGKEQRAEVGSQKSEHRTQETQQTRNATAWHSSSDTEVILRAYSRWGIESLQKLRGMFAFAIWDNKEEKLILARDPFGIKPLYYYQTESSFLFASEVRALLASGLVPRKVSQNGLISYLQFGSVQDPVTMVDGVRALLPGHCLVVRFKGEKLQVEIANYAQHLFEQTGTRAARTRRAAVEVLRAKLEESVRLHLVSDVPLGAFLSGGIDSSAIVALMSRVANQKPRTFSVVFDETLFSEAAHAKLVARMFGTEHHEILLSEERLLELLPGALEAMDQPTMDGINTFVISKAVKEAGVTVALSGLGGDELFAGYPSFRRAARLRRMALLPENLRKSASTLGRTVLNGSPRLRKFWDMVESDCGPDAVYAISRRLFAPDELSALVTGGQRSEVGGQRSEVGGQRSAVGGQRPEVRSQRSEIRDCQDAINAVSIFEMTGYMPNTLLRDTDQMSMAHALEVRVPFIDLSVVQYVLGLPGGWKMDGRRPKPLLLDALGNSLPEGVWQRPKMGFTLPFQRWMNNALETELNRAFCSGDDMNRLGVNSDYAQEVWQAFKRNPQQEPWSRPWALYVLKRWCDLNDVHL